MAFRLKTEIDDAPDHRGGVPALIVAEQIVSKKEVAGPAQDLFRRRHRVGRVLDIEQRVGPVLAEIGRRNMVGAGPDPEIAHIGGGLVGSAIAYGLAREGLRVALVLWRRSKHDADDLRAGGRQRAAELPVESAQTPMTGMPLGP